MWRTLSLQNLMPGLADEDEEAEVGTEDLRNREVKEKKENMIASEQ